jgi:hypothetical protein
VGSGDGTAEDEGEGSGVAVAVSEGAGVGEESKAYVKITLNHFPVPPHGSPNKSLVAAIVTTFCPTANPATTDAEVVLWHDWSMEYSNGVP